jgi:predicted ABC-type ATPase
MPALSASVDDISIVDSFFTYAPDPTTSPQLVFMAGGFGSGKSSIIARLSEMNVFPLSQFLLIDPDRIRELLPEYKELVAKVGIEETISLMKSHTQQLEEKIRIRAMQHEISVIFDTALWSAEAQTYVKDVLSEGLNYRSTLVYINTHPATATKRVQQREIEAGRGASERLVKISNETAADSFRCLKSLFDTSIEINNDIAPVLVSIARTGNKEPERINRPLSDALPMIISLKRHPIAPAVRNR